MSKIPNGRKCMVVGCANVVKAKELCAVHYLRQLRGADITAPVITRSHEKHAHCTVSGCEKPVKARGLCGMHIARLDRHGDIDHTRHERGVCSVDGCEAAHIAKGLCRKHYYRLERTGSLADPETIDRVCEIDGCDEPHVAKGLCRMHYMRLERHGDVAQTRPADWGAREKHPLYATWNDLMRHKSAVTCDRWRDLWAFVEDIGDSRPSAEHTIQRMDETAPYGPENAYWREPRTSGNSPDVKAQRAAYMRTWYKTNSRSVMDGELRKRYGIGADDYDRMMDEQDGVCAICGKEETRVDHRTKKVTRLAVDHDHATRKVRGLLCHAHNNSLGHFGDDPMILAKAIGYLAVHSGDVTAALSAVIAYLSDILPKEDSC